MAARVAGAGFAAFVLLLAGCATTSRTAPSVDNSGAVLSSAPLSWPERRAALQALEAFNLRGRVAVSTGSDGFNARLRWTQTNGNTDLALDGPLGVGGVRISSDGKDLAVVTSKGEHLDRAAAQAELQARLGFEPPIAQLRYWVLGVPSPQGEAHETLDADSKLVALEQDGWQINYSDYRAAAGGAATGGTPRGLRPSRITLTRDALRVRVVVDTWS